MLEGSETQCRSATHQVLLCDGATGITQGEQAGAERGACFLEYVVTAARTAGAEFPQGTTVENQSADFSSFFVLSVRSKNSI